MAWSVRTEGTNQLRELQERIKEAGDTGMRRKFRKEVRDAGQPAVTAIKAAALAVQVTSQSPPAVPRTGRHRGPRTTGLRKRVAGAVGISQTRKGIRIRVSARKMGPYGVTLPRYLDADLNRWKRWRHPVFQESLGAAHHRRVAQQRGQPYFFVTIQKHRAGFRKAVFDVMEQTGKELTR